MESRYPTEQIFDIANGDEYKIMGESVTGVNTLVVYTVGVND